ncbi:MFS transporter [Streptomyces sp. NPDC085479]|uniref:MFS transporter n=1 Tax=Streptomyces sp. NPDC085479 TaxID=3365726 RepID=UPI0037CD3537
MIGNAVTAVGAGVITAAASSTAAFVVAPERRGRALAFVLGGLTLATALGMPLGTLIGGAGWQLRLWAVAGIGVLAALGVAAGLPRVELPAASQADRLRSLGQAHVPALLVVTSLVVLGAYTLDAYVDPALRARRAAASRCRRWSCRRWAPARWPAPSRPGAWWTAGTRPASSRAPRSWPYPPWRSPPWRCADSRRPWCGRWSGA